MNETEDNKITLKCRHCSVTNRVPAMHSANNPYTIACGSCQKPLLFGEFEYFENICPTTYEHPLDKQALAALKKIPGTETLLKFILSEISERQQRMLYMQAAIHVHQGHIRPLHDLVVYAARVLGVSPTPELYIMQSPTPNAMTTGVTKPIIILTTALVELLDEKQLLGVMGHELGHIQAGHQLYRTALNLILSAATSLIPIPNMALFAITQGLMHWYRCSELTCDRAQMLVQRHFDGFVECEMKLAGGGGKINPYLDPDAFRQQAKEAAEMGTNDFLSGIFSNILSSKQTHPFPVWRVGMIEKWIESGDFTKIMAGNYTKVSTQSKDTTDHSTINKEPSSGVNQFLGTVRKFLDKYNK